MTEEKLLSDWKKQQIKNARHRAMIMQILTQFPLGLTVQQIIEKEKYFFGYTFVTDNRLRELRQIGWVENVVRNGDLPQLWKPKKDLATFNQKG